MVHTMTGMARTLAENLSDETNLDNSHFITRWLSSANRFWFTLYAGTSAFGLYTCVYAFRKTFAAATFEDLVFMNVDYKIWLVTFQVFGYACSKFIGIKLISELDKNSRSKSILRMTCIAGICWLFFGMIPAPYNIIFLLINGLSLGLVWGMVFGYLEGRRVTEALGAFLSVSFIFSSGLCRSAGSYLMVYWGISENWMPLAASCLFILPLLGFLALLDKVPPPSREDEELRTKRNPMNGKERKKFIAAFFPGILLFILAYMLLTSYRDFRDNFSAEVWQALGYGNSPAIYTKTEIPVSIAVLIITGSVMFLRNNKTALMVNHIIIASGMILIGMGTFMFEQEWIDAPVWMMLVGLGLYLGYVPFNSIFFDRLMATFKYTGTVGFIMYVADAFGYFGSIGVLFVKEFSRLKLSWLEFFISAGYTISIIGTALILGSMVYFHHKHSLFKIDRRKPQRRRNEDCCRI